MDSALKQQDLRQRLAEWKENRLKQKQQEEERKVRPPFIASRSAAAAPHDNILGELKTFNNNNNKIKNPSVYDNFKTKQTTSTLVSQSSLTQKQQQQQQPQYHHQTHQLPQQQNKLVSEDENTNIQQINTPPSATDLHIHTSTAAAITRSKIMEFQSRFIRDMIQSHPLYFYTCMHPLVVKTVKSNNNEDKVLDYSHVPPTASCYFPIPQIDLFSAQDAYDAAKRGQVELARLLFTVVANAAPTRDDDESPTFCRLRFMKSKSCSSSSSSSSSDNDDQSCSISPPPRTRFLSAMHEYETFSLNFWIKWARFEEECQEYANVVEVYERASALFQGDAIKTSLLGSELRQFMMRISHLYEKDEEDEDEEKEEKELEEGEIIENEYPQVSVFHGTSSHNTSDSNNTCSNNGDLNMMLCSDLDQDVLAVSSPPSLNALTSEAMGLYRSPNKFDQECSFSSDDEVEGGNHGNGGRRDGDIKKTPLPISRFLMDNNSGGGDNDGHKCEDNNDDDDDDAMFNELVDFEGGAGSKDSQLDDDLSAKLGAIRLGGGGGKISFAATPGKSTASVSSSTMETAAVSRTPGPLGSALRQTTPFSTRSRRDCVAAGMERVVMDLLMEQHEIPTLSDDEGEEEEEEVEDESNVLNQDMHPSQQPQTSYLNKNANSKKKMLGVRFNVENQPLHDTIEKNVDAAGSVVIVMTPVRAKKKEREVLGVDSVVTPVRRSRRLYNDEDYVATKEEMMAATAKGQEHQEKHQDESTSSSSSSGPTTPSTSNDRYKQQGDQLSKLLAEHGFAYVPNKAFPLPQTKTPLSGGGIGGSGSGGAGGGRRVSRAGHTPFQRSTARAATPRKYSGSASEEES